MNLRSSAVRDLYTRRLGVYAAFVGFFRSQHGVRAMLKRANVIQPDMAVLDAGCGFGLASLALLEAMESSNLTCARMQAFDLTPAMLSRFREHLTSHPEFQVETRECDVMAMQALPASWNNYDLVISTSMLEYLPRHDLAHALANLRARIVSGGHIFVMMTRKTIEAKLLIEMGWQAQRYSRSELRAAFAQAGFVNQQFIPFPMRYAWMARANHVVVAQCPCASVA